LFALQFRLRWEAASRKKTNNKPLRNKEAVLMLVVPSATASPAPQIAGVNTGDKRMLFDKMPAKYSV